MPRTETKLVNLKKLVLITAKITGMFYISRYLTRQKLRILAYHGIWYSDGHYGNHLFMKPKTFSQRMTWLSASKYTVLPLSEALDQRKNNTLPPCPVAITIDDGWYGTYKYMLPTLEQLSLPAMLYVWTSAVDTQAIVTPVFLGTLCHGADVKTLELDADEAGECYSFALDTPHAREETANKLRGISRNMGDVEKQKFINLLNDRLQGRLNEFQDSRQLSNMTYDEIADANRRGMDIQLHTHSHRLDLSQPQKCLEDIEVNREKLSPHVSGPLVHFCYPSGRNTIELQEYLKKSGIKSATTTDIGLNDRHTNPFKLFRILDGEDISTLEIEAELSGLMEIFRSMKSAIS